MRKKDLERARDSFTHNNSTNTDALRARVSRDLNVIKDSYDFGSLVLTEMGKHLSLHTGTMDSKELANIAKAYADISRTLIALRDEGRTTIKEAQGVDPPEPAQVALEADLSDPPKISSPRAAPTRIGEYLQALNPASAEKDESDGET